jgi:hypothetical protein
LRVRAFEGGVTVTGSVQIQQCALQSGFVGPGIKIGGDFQCINNGGGCQAELGDVHGFVQIQGNNSSAPSDISLVSVGGSLQCHGNTPAPTHTFGVDFVAGNLQGQCAANLGFAPTRDAPNCVASTLNVPNLTVTSAMDVPATGTTPEYCQVIGAIATNGEGYGAGSALFRLRLPVVWNNHFLFEGCGSNCGSTTSISVNTVDSGEALGLGYAVVNTDTGHEQDPTTDLLTWGVSETGVVNMPAIIDFFYHAVHQVTVATKQYVEAYYSQPGRWLRVPAGSYRRQLPDAGHTAAGVWPDRQSVRPSSPRSSKSSRHSQSFLRSRRYGAGDPACRTGRADRLARSAFGTRSASSSPTCHWRPPASLRDGVVAQGDPARGRRYPLHDEEAIFASEAAQLGTTAGRERRSLNWVAGLTAFKAVLLEGLEVVFIVIAVGSGRGLLWPASLGAFCGVRRHPRHRHPQAHNRRTIHNPSGS